MLRLNWPVIDTTHFVHEHILIRTPLIKTLIAFLSLLKKASRVVAETSNFSHCQLFIVFFFFTKNVHYFSFLSYI